MMRAIHARVLQKYSIILVKVGKAGLAIRSSRSSCGASGSNYISHNVSRKRSIINRQSVWRSMSTPRRHGHSFSRAEACVLDGNPTVPGLSRQKFDVK